VIVTSPALFVFHAVARSHSALAVPFRDPPSKVGNYTADRLEERVMAAE